MFGIRAAMKRIDTTDAMVPVRMRTLVGSSSLES